MSDRISRRRSVSSPWAWTHSWPNSHLNFYCCALWHDKSLTLTQNGPHQWRVHSRMTHVGLSEPHSRDVEILSHIDSFYQTGFNEIPSRLCKQFSLTNRCMTFTVAPLVIETITFLSVECSRVDRQRPKKKKIEKKRWKNTANAVDGKRQWSDFYLLHLLIYSTRATPTYDYHHYVRCRFVYVGSAIVIFWYVCLAF